MKQGTNQKIKSEYDKKDSCKSFKALHVLLMYCRVLLFICIL